MEISPTKRAQIVALINSGQKQIDVAKQLVVSQQLVSLTMKRCRDTGGFDSRRRSGRPRATTAALPTPISARTVRRQLSAECDLNSG